MTKSPLKKITTKIGSGATPTGGQASYRSSGISLIRSQNVLDFKFSEEGLAYIDESQASSLNNVTVKESDILLNITGDSIARACIVPRHILPSRVNQHVAIIRCSNEVDSQYVFYYLQFLKPYLLKVCGVGGTRNALTKEVIERLEIDLSLNQEGIAKTLSVLDASIDLNGRISTVLKAIARTLYDYWFVQFDFPDANGKPYKSSGGKMVYNKALKRDIPKDWSVKTLSEITSTATQSVNPANFPDKVFKHLSIPSFDAVGSFFEESGNTIGSNKFKVCSTDILVSKLNPKFSRVVYVTNEEDLISSTEFVVWRPENQKLKPFLYSIAKDPSFISFCQQSASGTSNSHRRINPTVMMEYRIAYSQEVCELFGRHIESSIKKMMINNFETKQLASLRDWLLPMLMNGQVTVK